MTVERFADTPNQGITTLDGALSDSATTIPVDSMADLKLTGLTGTDFAYCKITKQENWRQHPINRKESFEIVKVTAVSGNDLTAIREVDGTSGTTFASGDIVEVVFVSIHYQHLVDALTDGTKELAIGKLRIGSTVSPKLLAHIGSNAPTGTYLDGVNNDGILVAPNVDRGIFAVEGNSEAWLLLTARDGTLGKNMFGIEVDGTTVFFRSVNNGLGLRQIFIQAEMDTFTGDLLLQPGGGDVLIGGDLYWVGAGTGIPFGFMYVDGAQTIIVALTVNTPAEVKDDGTTSADDGWLAGDLNLFTMAAADLHYFSPNLAGKYEIVWDLSFNMASPGANVEIHGGIAIDGTPITDKGAAHRTIANNTDTGNMCGLAILELAADAEISLWLENTTNSSDVTVHHGNVTAKMVGG